MQVRQRVGRPPLVPLQSRLLRRTQAIGFGGEDLTFIQSRHEAPAHLLDRFNAILFKQQLGLLANKLPAQLVS